MISARLNSAYHWQFSSKWNIRQKHWKVSYNISKYKSHFVSRYRTYGVIISVRSPAHLLNRKQECVHPLTLRKDDLLKRTPIVGITLFAPWLANRKFQMLSHLSPFILSILLMNTCIDKWFSKIQRNCRQKLTKWSTFVVKRSRYCAIYQGCLWWTYAMCRIVTGWKRSVLWVFGTCTIMFWRIEIPRPFSILACQRFMEETKEICIFETYIVQYDIRTSCGCDAGKDSRRRLISLLNILLLLLW